MATDLKINIIGRGNVGSHLYNAYKELADIKLINPHILEGLDRDADLTLISVTDDAIPEILLKLPELRGIIAHTSGSTGIDVFSEFGRKELVGVFYPLQTFSKNTTLNYAEIPFLIEATDKDSQQKLCKIASYVSNNVIIADSDKRADLHVAAVFACNFTNHLWSLASSFLDKADLDFDILLPLIKETVSKVSRISPEEAQTGPAVRNDDETILKHLARLKDQPELAEIYRQMTKSIKEFHKHHKK